MTPLRRKLAALYLTAIFALWLGPDTTAWLNQKIQGGGKIKGNGTITNVASGGVSFTYVVSPSTGTPIAPCASGSDSNNGTSVSTPFASIDHARSVARASGLLTTQPVVIMFCGGTYYQQATPFAGADSGNLANPVTYRNYPGHTPVLSGGQLIQGSWATSVTGACATAVTTCYSVSIPNSAPMFERLFYYDAGAVNYGVLRYRPRLGTASYSLTSVANGASGLTVYTGTTTACASNACVNQTIFITGFMNAANNGRFKVNSSTSTTLTMNGATGISETHAATALYDNGLYGHSTGPYPGGTATSSGATITNSTGDGFSSLANGYTIYYGPNGSGSCAAFPCPYTVSSVGGGGTTVTLTCTVGTTCPATEASPVAYEAFIGTHYSTASTVNGIPNVNPASAYACVDCRIYGFDKWIANIMLVPSTGITIGTQTIATTCANKCPSVGGPGAPYLNGYRYVFENFKEGLLQGGQWYLDRSASNPNFPNYTLSYVPLGGENPNTDAVVIPSNNQLITASSLAYVTFSGLTMEHDNWAIPSTGYLAVQQDYNLAGTIGLVSCVACTNVTFSTNVFRDNVTVALAFTGASSSDTVSGNVFYDIGAYALRMGISPVGNGTTTDSQVPNNNTISQNWFEQTNRFIPGTDGYSIGLANNIVNSYNDVGFTYHAGVEVCMPTQNTCQSQPYTSGSHGAFNITFVGMNIHDLGQGVTTDTGGLYAMTSYCPTSGPPCSGGNSTATGNSITLSRIHDVNSSVVNGDTADVGAHCIYLDGNTGGWTVQNNLCYRVTGEEINQNFGPGSAGIPNNVLNNILVNSARSAGIGSCIRVQTPLNTVLEFNYENNICSMDLAGSNTVNDQTGPPAASSASFQNYVSNLYSFAGTPQFNIVGHLGISFATWKGTYGEDTASTISTSPGFTASGNCANNSTVPVVGVCDDFNVGAGPGFGFVPFTQVFGPSATPTIPVVADYFPVATLPLAQF